MDQTLSIGEGFASTLDYWEADPAWDGGVFRSAAQAVRPRKNRPIAHALRLPTPPGETICVRWVTVAGEHGQAAQCLGDGNS